MVEKLNGIQQIGQKFDWVVWKEYL